MKVLVTGGSGFIGQYVVDQLIKKQHEVHVAYKKNSPKQKEIFYHRVDLLNYQETTSFISDLKPTHLLHLAWFAKPPDFWNSDKNLDWVSSSLNLLNAFHDNNGKKAVLAGTCAEYSTKKAIFKETEQVMHPTTVYGNSKNLLQKTLFSRFNERSIDISWGRIFFPYGPNEDKSRFFSSLIVGLLNNNNVECNNPHLIRDYIHVRDVASAFVVLLESDFTGPINISSGNAYSLGDLASLIATKMNKTNLLDLGEEISENNNQIPQIVGDNSLLKSLGWKENYNIDKGIEDLINTLNNERIK